MGATLALCPAELGLDVVGIDGDPAKAARLTAGEVPSFEPALEALLWKRLESGRPRCTTSLAGAAASEVQFICVGPPRQPGSPAAEPRYVGGLTHGGRRPGSFVHGTALQPGNRHNLRVGGILVTRTFGDGGETYAPTVFQKINLAAFS